MLIDHTVKYTVRELSVVSVRYTAVGAVWRLADGGQRRGVLPRGD